MSAGRIDVSDIDLSDLQDSIEQDDNDFIRFEFDDPCFDQESGVWIKDRDVRWKLGGDPVRRGIDGGDPLTGALTRLVDGTETDYPWDRVLELIE